VSAAPPDPAVARRKAGGSAEGPAARREPPNGWGGRRLVRAWIVSLEGLGAALKHEAAFRQECALALVLLPLALALDLPIAEKILLMAAVVGVLIVELLNTAVEWAVNEISELPHPYAKRSKDIASAAVFLSLLFAGLTWALILLAHWPPGWAEWVRFGG
jgi:diacylglycerol kinase (ATP)